MLRLREQARTQHLAEELFKGTSSDYPFNGTSDYPFNDTSSDYPFNDTSSDYPFNDTSSDYPFNDTSTYPITGFFQEPSEESSPFSDRQSGRWKTQRPDEVHVTVTDDAATPNKTRNSLRTNDTHSSIETPSETLSLNRQLALITEDKTRCRFSEVSRSRFREITSRRRGESRQAGDAAEDVAGRGGGSRVRPGNACARRFGRFGD